MARPPRIEFPGAVYHLSSWCEPGVPAFADDEDRAAFLALLAQTLHRFDAQLLSYCLLPDHFHLLLFTRRGNLSQLMRHLLGVYTQQHHLRHGGSGTLFHGRFKAVLVDREAHLLDTCRYIELNPLRMGLVKDLAQWPWSSYPAHAGLVAVPEWLEADGLWAFVLGRALSGAADRRRAAERYAKLQASDAQLRLWPGRLRQQIFLGDEAFARRMLAQGRRSRPVVNTKAAPGQWADWLARSDSREQALYQAHTEGGMSMSVLAQTLGLSVSRVSRLVAAYERGLG